VRTVCSLLACWLMAIGVCGQGRFSVNGGQPGQIAFGNYIPNWGVDAPVFDVDCQTRLEGPRFVSEVYAGFAPEQLQPLGLVVPFKSGIAAGYIVGRVYDVPGAHSGTIVYTQLRAWDSQAGATYEAAVANGGKYGFSNIVPIRAEVPLNAPQLSLGLESFCLVPEPTALSLLGCAAGIAFVWRRTAGRGSRLPGLMLIKKKNIQCT
jgi:hypothetical protein